MSGEWKWLISPINGLPHRVFDDPNNPGVLASFVGRDFEVTDIPGDLDPDQEEFQLALAERQAAKDAEELKGGELDDALDKAGLSKSGTVKEKRQRLAEKEAATTPSNDGGQPEGNK